MRGPGSLVAQALMKVKGVTDVSKTDTQGDRNTFTVQVRHGADLRDEISKAVISNGWGLLSLLMVSMSLEEIFLRLTTSGESDA